MRQKLPHDQACNLGLEQTETEDNPPIIVKEQQMKTIHKLKILPEYFNAVKNGDKRFEFRYNDRNYHVGDVLRLQEWDGQNYTGQEIDVSILYILHEWQGMKPGWCVMSIKKETT